MARSHVLTRLLAPSGLRCAIGVATSAVGWVKCSIPSRSRYGIYATFVHRLAQLRAGFHGTLGLVVLIQYFYKRLMISSNTSSVFAFPPISGLSSFPSIRLLSTAL